MGSVDITLTEEWQEYSFIAYAEEETNGVRLAKFAFQNDGEYWIDDVWLEEIPPTPVICNGDFENYTINTKKKLVNSQLIKCWETNNTNQYIELFSAKLDENQIIG